MGSTLYESWVTRLRVSWMGKNARAMFGGFAAALGDKTIDWARQGVLEHLPAYAGDPISVALTASDRQLDTYPGEPTADIAARAPYWLQINKFRGRGLGILIGLHFAGFDGAVLVQQNGRALQLALPLPPFTDNWDPTPNLIVTPCSPLAIAMASNVHPPTASSAGKTAPGGHAWWTHDCDTEFCSRFSVLFPAAGPLVNSTFLKVSARATFAGTDSAVATWSSSIALATPSVYFPMPGPPVVTDGGGPVVVYADASSLTSTAMTVRASAPFTGYVDSTLLGMTVADLSRLQATIAKWRNAKATCVGVFVCAQGKFMGWPVQPQANNTMGPCSIVRYPGA